MDIKVKWLEHEFTVHRHGADWHNVAGLYIFSGKDPKDNKWFPLYIGQALSLSERLPRSRKVVGGGATWCDACPCDGGTLGDEARLNRTSADSVVSAVVESSTEVVMCLVRASDYLMQ